MFTIQNTIPATSVGKQASPSSTAFNKAVLEAVQALENRERSNANCRTVPNGVPNVSIPKSEILKAMGKKPKSNGAYTTRLVNALQKAGLEKGDWAIRNFATEDDVRFCLKDKTIVHIVQR